MGKYILFTLLLVGLIGCSEDDPGVDCTIEATVRDMTGLDGCGFVLQTDDGKYYEPAMIFFCGTGLTEDEIPKTALSNFTFRDGQRVRFGYEPADMGSICMIGEVVWVTCIEEISSTSNQF